MTAIDQLAHQLAQEYAISSIEANGEYTSEDGWYDLSGLRDEDREALYKQASYLEQRGLLERKAENPAIVRIKPLPKGLASPVHDP
jgi:hypothetical protein